MFNLLHPREKQITVREVIEQNDCSGKKHIFVTAIEEDESAVSRFRLTRAYMFPHEKILLASVCPTDVVTVAYDYFPLDPTLAGEFTGIHSDIGNRDPLCRCGIEIMSDGMEIYCPNKHCALTLSTRIRRLATTQFTQQEMCYFDPQTGEEKVSISINQPVSYYQPFQHIAQGIFWGHPGGSLEQIILNKYNLFKNLSLANFLIEPLFRELLESILPLDANDNNAYLRIEYFYSSMEEFVNNRDYNSHHQQLLIHAFMSCLGIESLSDDHIKLMMDYEQNIGGVWTPLLSYAFLLTHPRELVTELGLHPAEATAIVGEVNRRSYELSDIFYHYTNKNHDVLETFRHEA